MFLTNFSYSINAIEHIEAEKLTLSKKMKVFKYNLFMALRLGHISHNKIHGLVKSIILNSSIFEYILVCESCLEGKMTKRPFTTKINHATK